MLGIGTTELILVLFILLTPLVVIGVIATVVIRSSRKRSGNLKKCPFCAELIQPEAIVCRFCDRDLEK